MYLFVFICICIFCTYLCLWVICLQVPSALRGQKRVMWVLGIIQTSFARTSAVNLGAIFTPYIMYLNHVISII